MSYYHGSDEQITTITGEICLTTDYDAAEDYALRKDGITADTGYIHTIDLAGARIADEDDLRGTATQVLGDLSLYPYTYELADNARVRAALAEQGYNGVAYDDQTITGRGHDTVLVWDAPSPTWRRSQHDQHRHRARRRNRLVGHPGSS